MEKRPKGLILFEGPSKVDGQPIVVIATMDSRNIKTGNMIQTWILHADMHPVDASRSGSDNAICGSCPHRHFRGGACYVVPAQAPANIYKSYKKGSYPIYDEKVHSKLFLARKIRLGAYGDPAVVPFEVWENVLQYTDGHTGYTHHYGAKHFDERLTQYCMVSVETPAQVKKALSANLRTFRAKPVGSLNLESEVTCLADSDGLSCEQCMLCDGGTGKANVVVNVHGQRKKRFDNKFGDVIMKQLA